MFYLGLRFSDDELNAYEQLTTTFELKASAQERAFLSLHINTRNFDSDVPRMIPIEKFSYNYFLSNTLHSIDRKYEVFKKNTEITPTFFKIQGNDKDYKAKLVRSTVLYTNVPYFAAFHSQYPYEWRFHLPSDIEVNDTFQFETMGRRFLGKVITIKTKTADIDSLVKSWGYQLDASETLTLLWPPAVLVNETSIINSSYAFLFSSFELQAHGNINVHSVDIKRITSGLAKVAFKQKMKVYRKNAEIAIDKNKQCSIGFDAISIVQKHDSTYTVPDDSAHFLFCRDGVISLLKGQSIPLIPGNVIKHFSYGYLDGLVYPLQQSELTGEYLLSDVLAHYKRTETFLIDAFDLSTLSKVAFQYIEKCRTSGLINSAAKRFIEEGRI